MITQQCPREYCGGSLYKEMGDVKCSLCGRWWDNPEDALAGKLPQVGSTVTTPRLGYRLHHKPLTGEQKVEIRNSSESLRTLADEFHVTHSAIWKIKHGKWK